MKTAKKTFAIVLLVLTLPIWLFQMGIRNVMSFDNYLEFSNMVDAKLDMQLFEFDEVYNAGRFLASIAGFAKFFEALIIPFCIVAAIYILRNSSKRKVTMLPGCVLLLIVIFNLFCAIAGNVINNIEIIESVADLLYYENVEVNLAYPVINTLSATINSALIAIPAIAFLTCGISDILYLKKNPEENSDKLVDPKQKKARVFYLISAACVVVLLLIASFISASTNVATITWIFRYFWQGYIILIIAAIVFYIIGNSMNPSTKRNKAKNAESAPAQVPAQQTTAQQFSPADELKKYKDLLDSGAITQEEYDAKKKELLGL